MKLSVKDTTEGTIHQIKGSVKEKTGKVTNNPDLESEGEGEKVAGKVQKKIGQLEKAVGE
ncbi:MAG: CsbD family protein [Acidobacteriia bacterium]|nr:CsbD family protein [Terriglobia bacterium]